jgi:hypothetical protein
MTAARQDLIQALSQIQNHPFYREQDILTITGVGMTDDEVRQHIDSCIKGITFFNYRQIDEAAAKPARRARKLAA